MSETNLVLHITRVCVIHWSPLPSECSYVLKSCSCWNSDKLLYMIHTINSIFYSFFIQPSKEQHVHILMYSPGSCQVKSYCSQLHSLCRNCTPLLPLYVCVIHTVSLYFAAPLFNYPSGVISEYVNPYIPSHTPEEYWSDHMQTQADSSFYVWPDVWFGYLQVTKSMVIYDTECPYWDQVSLNTQTKPND